MTLPLDAEKWPPSYPPRTPPPPKRPVEPPRPEPRDRQVALRPRVRMRIANRRAGNWTFDTAPWAAASAPARAGRAVLDRLRSWGHPLPEQHPVVGVTVRLVRAAVADGGRRASVHLADQERDGQVVVLVLSHEPSGAPEDDRLLQELAGLGVVSAGTENSRDDGARRRWAVVAV
ncbi:hypothetical protein RND61_24760 [Streptomyces sp. TRM76323]|uniref:Uncharacterized protein n=1 Tax=Streptomyces tamarix TaxID=3078565 RepID=A0ABU3QR73_9ACTN|nr:hypothetical protein [Streptomyces tamarix]MDT9685248.1 hypothetical protein [Streptomyces tamarix]